MNFPKQTSKFHSSLLWSGALIILASLATVTPSVLASDLKIPDAEERFDAFEAQLAGAATATRRRMLEQLRQEFDGEIVGFSGSIYNLSEISLKPAATAIPGWGASFFSWEHEGLMLKQPQPDPSTTISTPRDRVRFRIGNVDSATLVILQGRKLKVYALTADQKLMDQLRSGVELKVEVLVSGLQGNSLFGILVGLADPEAELYCANGHHFSVSTGFKYCPFCGSKLAESPPPA